MTDWYKRPSLLGPAFDSHRGSDELREKIDFAVEYVRLALRKDYPSVETSWFGVVGINPRHLAIWVITETDSDRDAILAEGGLIRLIQDSLRAVNYPAEAIPYISGTVESQETVDRDYHGNWYLCMK